MAEEDLETKQKARDFTIAEGDFKILFDSMGKSKGQSAWAEVYWIVKRIPRGRVMNYGQIARLLKRPLSARAVGWALNQCPAGLPWHRVVNASGGCSTDKLGDHPRGLQRALLEAEGVRFGSDERMDIEHYRWTPCGKTAKSRVTRRFKKRTPGRQHR